jgi:RHS repeat-associated protein
LYDDVFAAQSTTSGTPGSTQNYLTTPGGDVLAYSVTSGSTTTTTVPLTDLLGSTLGMVNSSGSLATTLTYEPFGKPTTTGTATSYPYLFAGVEYDQQTGLYHMFARYYSPTLQRFISDDPLGFGGGDVNPFTYASNDPVDAIDPLGLQYCFYGLAGDLAGLIAEIVGDGPDATPGQAAALSDALGHVSIGNGSTAGGASGGSAPAGSALTAAGVPADQILLSEADPASTFIKQHLKEAKGFAEQLHVPVEYFLGLAGKESFWGKNRLAREDNNFFSLHWSDKLTHTIGKDVKPWDPILGKHVPVAEYNSFADSAQSFVDRYGSAIRAANPRTPLQFGRALQNAGFNTHPGYAHDLAGVIHSVRKRLPP